MSDAHRKSGVFPLLMVVSPLLIVAALVALVPVGGAPGMVHGFLLLPAVGVSLFGCVWFIVRSSRKGWALLILPVTWAAYVASLPATAELVAWRRERFLDRHVDELRELAESVLRGDSTVAEANDELRERGWSIRTEIPRREPRDAVVFVLGGALDDQFGIAFSTSGRLRYGGAAGR